MRSKLARSLPLSIKGSEIGVETPLLIPSFSSKAEVDIRSVFEALQPAITYSFLVSAYDIFYCGVEVPETAPAEVLFLDSGGYEVSKDHDRMDPMYVTGEPRCWTRANHRQVVSGLDTVMPTFVTAFDHPEFRQPLACQIDIALEFFKDFPQFGREILIKPGSADERLLNIHDIYSQVHRFNEFDIIGVTEVELGDSIIERMENIARLRQVMDSTGVIRPLHIFGSLDPVCTPLYFLSGADIFDGLSWLRFAYSDDLAIYHRNRVPLQFGPEEREHRGRTRSVTANLHYLSYTLTTRFKKYLLDGDVRRLETHATFFKEALDNLRVRLPEGVV